MVPKPRELSSDRKRYSPSPAIPVWKSRRMAKAAIAATSPNTTARTHGGTAFSDPVGQSCRKFGDGVLAKCAAALR
jgi:hypothetical protein